MSEFERKLPSFAWARTLADAPPRDGLVLGTHRGVDVSSSRRLLTKDGKAIFAAPAASWRLACFSISDDDDLTMWAGNFCTPVESIGTAGLVWNLSVAGNPRTPNRLIIWGIVGSDVSEISLRYGVRVVATIPTADGIFMFDAAGDGYPDELLALSNEGVVIGRAVPRV